ncbi:hypothetical protein RIF29_15902 [Crotalaria pallida]|uniref:Uncharacterized protein n=1 Tax=Crotalaria pallida TaxID=3830 RepID=A0AAN9FMQ0_CROPI
MYTWYAMGHLIPFLHLSNKLAKRGHKISFIIPKRTQTKLQHLNLHPHLITFVPIALPHVDGLPHEAETTSDAPKDTLEEKWSSWLGGFKEGSVIYCALGTECLLNQNQLQELLLGLELTEALVSKCQLVLLPGPYTDHVINARKMSIKLKVGVEVEKGEEDGFFTKESVSKAVRIVMDDGNELGREVRANHTKVRNMFQSNNFESSCVDSFCHELQNLL